MRCLPKGRSKTRRHPPRIHSNEGALRFHGDGKIPGGTSILSTKVNRRCRSLTGRMAVRILVARKLQPNFVGRGHFAHCRPQPTSAVITPVFALTVNTLSRSVQLRRPRCSGTVANWAASASGWSCTLTCRPPRTGIGNLHCQAISSRLNTKHQPPRTAGDCARSKHKGNL
jgi:hypothetical protein